MQKSIKIDTTTPWIPAALKAQSPGFKYHFRFSKAERIVMRKRKRIPVSQWVEQHRVITLGNIKGKWKNSITPYGKGIMDASFFPSVQTIIVCAADQGGKSEFANNCIGYAIDRDPGPVLFVYPDEQTAKENSRDRILPMIQDSDRLRTYFTGTQDDEATMRINLQHMPIYMAWARSAARLANKPIRYLVFDETDKYPLTAGKREADPISKGEKRTRTFRYSRKIWKLSTPTIETGPITMAMKNEAQVIFDYLACCPKCGKMQVMDFKQIKWPKDERDPEVIEAKELAWYECKKCKAKWNDHKRNIAVQWGRWQARGTRSELFNYLKKHRPKKIGFHVPSWYFFFVSISEAAAAFLRGLQDKTKLKDFRNSHQALPWTDYTQEREEDKILALRDDRGRGIVPSGGVVSCLTAGVDTHDNGFWYEIRAWGWGSKLESWQIREGFVDSFEALTQVLFEDRYTNVDDKDYRVRLAVQDALGHRTSEVYDFARMNRGRLYPFKGEQRMARPWAIGNIDVYPGTKKPIPGGIKLLRADVTFFKNQLAHKLEIAPADPGAWHLHAEANFEWARQMCAEYIDEKGYWQCPDSRANEAWDCSVYNLVAADMMGVKFWAKPGEVAEAVAPAKPRKGFQRPDWLDR